MADRVYRSQIRQNRATLGSRPEVEIYVPVNLCLPTAYRRGVTMGVTMVTMGVTMVTMGVTMVTMGVTVAAVHEYGEFRLKNCPHKP